MMSAQPAYHMHADGTNAVLEGQEQVKSLYRLWAETNQSIFYAEGEEVAVAVHAFVHQQVWGKVTVAKCCRIYRTTSPKES